MEIPQRKENVTRNKSLFMKLNFNFKIVLISHHIPNGILKHSIVVL